MHPMHVIRPITDKKILHNLSIQTNKWWDSRVDYQSILCNANIWHIDIANEPFLMFNDDGLVLEGRPQRELVPTARATYHESREPLSSWESGPSSKFHWHKYATITPLGRVRCIFMTLSCTATALGHHLSRLHFP